MDKDYFTKNNWDGILIYSYNILSYTSDSNKHMYINVNTVLKDWDQKSWQDLTKYPSILTTDDAEISQVRNIILIRLLINTLNNGELLGNRHWKHTVSKTSDSSTCVQPCSSWSSCYDDNATKCSLISSTC